MTYYNETVHGLFEFKRYNMINSSYVFSWCEYYIQYNFITLQDMELSFFPLNILLYTIERNINEWGRIPKASAGQVLQ